MSDPLVKMTFNLNAGVLSGAKSMIASIKHQVKFYCPDATFIVDEEGGFLFKQYYVTIIDVKESVATQIKQYLGRNFD